MVLVYIDQADQQIKKSSLEAMSYGAALAKQLGCDVAALVLGTVQDNLAALGKNGAQKVYHLKNESLNSLDVKLHSTLIANAAKNVNATVVVFAHNINGRAIAPAVAVKLEAG
ncbi:MAG: electron transfer flavoprotein subunit alpha/FixB family protein, partial [Chitinophagaceae bacterium]|nr:electron transfer flavoprotein subunit alpha/FixB family protein [Chitinophagaceae bacterium]